MISTSFASCTHHLLAARLTGLAADDPVRDVLSRHDSRVVPLTQRSAPTSGARPTGPVGYTLAAAVRGVPSPHDSRVVRLTGHATEPLVVIVCGTAALHFKYFWRDRLQNRECTKGLSAVNEGSAAFQRGPFPDEVVRRSKAGRQSAFSHFRTSDFDLKSSRATGPPEPDVMDIAALGFSVPTVTMVGVATSTKRSRVFGLFRALVAQLDRAPVS